MTVTMRPELTATPERIRRLPLDARGYPVPWFVQWINGAPDFRVMDGQKFARAIKERRCWVCGDVLGRYLVFVTGPMCALNRTNAEPPCHQDCAIWSAINCPFLSRPRMVRREDEFTDSCRVGEAALDRNPGVACLWTTRGYGVYAAKDASATGYLIRMGDPLRVDWYAAGRRATRAEVTAALDSGLPLLAERCEMETTPALRAEAHEALADARRAIELWLPR